jgi:F-type H+-transporting ATPase subunit alpha
VCVVYAGVRGFLDNVVTSEIPKFEEKFLAFLKESHPKIIEDILKFIFYIRSGELSKANDELLKTLL